VTQSDKPAQRGNTVAMTPVKRYAIANGLKVFTPARVSREIDTIFADLEAKPDVIVTCAFGQILKQNVIDACRFGVINVHASLLPKYRGASPVPYAIMDGETKTGITIMKTDIGIDTGDIILQEETDILPEETSGEVLEKLAKMAPKLLENTLEMLEKGHVLYQKQGENLTRYCKMITKNDGKIDFNMGAKAIVNFVRAMSPWPGAWAESTHGIIKVHKAHVERGDDLVIDLVQAEGGRIMPMRDFKNGHKGFEFK
jgi:methionyl-tRNA formyltransferase